MTIAVEKALTDRSADMKVTPVNSRPADAAERQSIAPVICYPLDSLPRADMALYESARQSLKLQKSVLMPPRDARIFHVPAGSFFRIVCLEGPQVGDLNLWSSENLQERFYSGKTRALHGTHLSTGDRMWSNFPYLRPMATITHDTLDWYGFDEFGGSVHDVIGTRCDPYTNHLLSGQDYHYCCHSNLSRVIAEESGVALQVAEQYVHDVLNVFMCTGFTQDTYQYFMKASPVRPGDYLEFFAEIDLTGALSACPGGDCSAQHSSEVAKCYPLKVDIYRPAEANLSGWTSPQVSQYRGGHGKLRSHP